MLENSQNFFASLKLAGLLQFNPTAYLSPPFPPDLIGLSPVPLSNPLSSVEDSSTADDDDHHYHLNNDKDEQSGEDVEFPTSKS